MTFQSVADEELMIQIRQGRQQALAELYDRYSRIVYGMALQKLREPAEAQDITHDVFVTMWKRVETFHPERGRVRPWLLTVAHHLIIDRLRHQQRAGEAQEVMINAAMISSTLSEESSAEAAQRSEESDQVRRALQDLPAEQREVIVMSYYQGLSQSQISQRQGIPLGTVKARSRLAMDKLRTAMVGR